MKYFIHIPKTGGTSIKYLTQGNFGWNYARHGRKLSDPGLNNVVFILRNPIERFLSAAKHLTAITSTTRESSAEFWVQRLNKEPKAALLFPMSRWLGTLSEYRELESRVVEVLDIAYISEYFEKFNLKHQRERDSTKYDTIFDDTLSEESINVLESFYAEDFALYDYIRQQPYYISGAKSDYDREFWGE